MSILKRLYSRNFFVMNLVLVGVIFGFALAFAGFSFGAHHGQAVSAESPSTTSTPVPPGAGLTSALAVQDAFRSIADNVLPAIVELDVTENVAPQQAQPNDQLPFRFFFGQPQDNGNGQPPDMQTKGLGSGIIVRRDGNTVYVLTNNHVAGSASSIKAVLSDGREYKSQLVGHDDRLDLALVKFETSDKNITVATLGDSSALHVGDWAIAIGSPFGYVSSMTVGIVSALGRSGGPDGNISDFIQTDASINKGNSGGALVNIKGEVVGINTWIASPTGTSVGLGFSIPINNAKKAIDDFITKKHIEYGWLGVSLRELDHASAVDLGVDGQKGAFIAHVFNGGPASKAGFLPGDFIVGVDGKSVKDQADVVRVVGELEVGKTASFRVVRDGTSIELNAHIEARDPKVAANDGNLFPGIDAISLDSSDLDQTKLPKGLSGVYVANVVPKSMASVAGLNPGDIVTAMNGGTVKSLRDFYRQLNDPKAKDLSITVNRDGQSVTLAYAKK